MKNTPSQRKLKLDKIIYYMIVGGLTSLFSMCLSILIFIFSIYFHEIGHVFFCIISYFLFNVTPQNICWSVWQSHLGIPTPMQTRCDPNINSLSIPLGGPLFTIIFSIFVAILFGKFMNRKSRFNNFLLFLLIILFSLRTVIGDFLFGTDNWIGGPLLSYGEYPFFDLFMNYSVYFILLTLFVSTFIIYLPVSKRLFNKIPKRK